MMHTSTCILAGGKLYGIRVIIAILKESSIWGTDGTTGIDLINI